MSTLNVQCIPAGWSGAPSVQLVMDNSSTHKTPAVKGWLARHPRF